MHISSQCRSTTAPQAQVGKSPVGSRGGCLVLTSSTALRRRARSRALASDQGGAFSKSPCSGSRAGSGSISAVTVAPSSAFGFGMWTG